jgi:hypothetical protein
VLVAGGATQAEFEPSVELYDPATGTWSPTGSMTTPRRLHSATVLEDGKVLVAGGAGAAGATASAEVYDPVSGQWSKAGSLAAARSDHTATRLVGPGCGSHCGKVLVVAGRDEKTSPIASAELYDPGGDEWSSAGSLEVRRFGHSATVLQDGRVLVAGGSGPFFNGSTTPLRSVEIYDPAAGESLPDGGPGPRAWSRAASMAVGRYLHGSARLSNGRVLVASGDTEGNIPNARASAQVYDPASNKWSFTGFLHAARKDHTATLLTGSACAPLCGYVLVGGGAAGAPQQSLASSELYDPAAPTRPATPGAVAAEPASHTSIRLSFSAPGTVEGAPPPASRYIVKQSSSPITASNFSRARSLCPGGVCRFSPQRVGDRLVLNVTGLRPSTRYHYALQALDDEGRPGPVSNGVQATTMPDRIAPARITDLRARATSASRIVLRFAAPGSDGAGPPPARRYIVKQSRTPIVDARSFAAARSLCDGGVCRFSPARVGDLLTITVTRLRAGTSYHYAVRAVDEAGNRGPISNRARATTFRAGG